MNAPQTFPGPLEQSFASIIAAHNLTVLAISMRANGTCMATAHYDGFAADGHNCSMEHDESIDRAIEKVLMAARANRTAPVRISLLEGAVLAAPHALLVETAP